MNIRKAIEDPALTLQRVFSEFKRSGGSRCCPTKVVMPDWFVQDLMGEKHSGKLVYIHGNNSIEIVSDKDDDVGPK